MYKNNDFLLASVGAIGAIALVLSKIKPQKTRKGSFYKKSKVVLYHLEYCPFCEMVREKLDELDIEWTSKDISKEKYKKELKGKRDGITTVPYIEIDGKGMGESSDIVEALEQKFGE